MDTGTNKL